MRAPKGTDVISTRLTPFTTSTTLAPWSSITMKQELGLRLKSRSTRKSHTSVSWRSSLVQTHAYAVALVVAVLCLCPSLWGATNTIYLSQTAGVFNGGSLCNGQSTQTYTDFNNSSNWTSGTPSGTQIGPGTTVVLCGTISAPAGSTPLTAQGNGSSGSPVTIVFDTGASLQEGYFGAGGAINLNSKTYITVNGANKGTIEATTNGTSGSNSCPSGSCTTQQSSQGITNPGSNDIIENLTVGPMYVVASTSDSAWTALQINCFELGSSSYVSSNLTATGNTAHDCLTGFEFYANGGGSNYTLSNNTSHGTCWGADVIENGATSFNNIYIFGNHDYDHSKWGASASCHSNALHLFQANNCSSCSVNGFYYYNNEDDGPGAPDTTAELQLDNNGGNSGVTNGNIFNNVFSWTSSDCSGTCDAQLGLWTGSGWLVDNNTFIGNATGSTPGGPLFSDDQSGVTFAFENNALTTSNQEMKVNTGLPLAGSPDYNIYANSPSSGQVFICSSNFYSAAQFSGWASCIGNETHSAYYATAPLPNCNSTSDCSNAQPQAGSTLIGSGTNLYSLCNGQPNPGIGALCYDKAGHARPSTGNWDIGAYQHSTGGLNPPTSLTGVVQP